MRQDTDVARMAAALRTPSLKYRSFGNEAVRSAPPPPATEDQAFSILGDALAGASELSPTAVMSDPAPVPTETPMLPARDSYRSYADVPPAAAPDLPGGNPVAPDPYAEIERVPAPAVPSLPSEPPASLPVVPAQPDPVPAALVLNASPVTFAATRPPVAPTPVAPPLPAPRPAAPEPSASSLLQVLLGGQPPQPSPVALPVSAPPPILPQPVAAAPVPPPLPVAPIAVPPVASMPMLSALSAGTLPWSPPRGGTGSSLLDTLMGVGEAAGASPIHYPLLDALGDAMRGTAAEPSPRLWPAARVDIALPELLRRVAAGVRFARPAA